MGIETKLERPKSLTAMAKQEIRDAIIEGRLSFSEQLSESALAAKLGISKTPVREALLQLKLEGLVDIEPQRGTFVFSLTEEQVHEICRFREVIETAALALAMERDCEGLAGRLALVLKQPHLERPEQVLSGQIDADFHSAILECCGNAYLQRAYDLISDKIHALRARLPKSDPHVDACRNTHAAIASLVRQGNIEEAQLTLSQHILSTEESYLAAIAVPQSSKNVLNLASNA
ncbi:MAG TPA: GntR family transcriptional regulator [Chthoniobacterales bacterium]|nr:GntR family transcriptional regulator [Chthoniobacterales bacterium]